MAFSSPIRLSIILIQILVVIIQPAIAQNKNTFGAIVGMNVSNVSDYDGQTRVSVTSGLYWESKLSNLFYLQSNFLYSQRGERESNITTGLKLHYLNLPLMIKYYLSEDLQAKAGIYWDLLIGVASYSYSNNDFKKSDFGIPIGISYDLNDFVQLCLSYNFGITNISVDDTVNFAPRNNWGNISMALLIR